jgi:uncharacterized integral membrane protein
VLQVVLVAALVFAVGIAVFAVQNTAPVAVSFLFWRADAVASSVLVLIAAALGAGLTLLLGVAREVRLRLRLRARGQELATAEARLRGAEMAAAPRPEGVGSTGAPAAS